MKNKSSFAILLPCAFLLSAVSTIPKSDSKESPSALLSGSSSPVSSDIVVAPAWKNFNLQPLKGKFATELRSMLLSSNKFALNTWYNERKKFDRQTEEYLDFGGRSEAQIRPVSHQVFALALSLRWNVYDPAVTGVSAKEAMRRTVRMTKSLCHHHKANAGKSGWGDAWQSALWASQTALAGWFLWDELDTVSRQDLIRMLEYEADRFLDYNVPYYKDNSGKIITPGDSKAEENAWNSTILVAANVMMPRHRHWKKWNEKAIELQFSAYAAPEDHARMETWNGFPLKQINGSNIESDGTVINHNIIHPDYMSAIMGSATNAWIYPLGGMKAPFASIFNGERVYQAMTDLKVKDGKTMYVSDNGKASCHMYYPQGNDWGNGRQANYWLLDIMADLFHWDKNSTVKGKEWATVRNDQMRYMQGRSTTGQYYQSPDEDKFPSREEWISYHLAFGYLGMWIHQNGLDVFTKEALTPPALP